MLFGIASGVTVSPTVVFGIFLFLAVIFLALCALVWGVQELRVDVQAVLQHQRVNLMSAIDNLRAAVAEQTAVDQSAVTLIQGIAEQLKNANSDTDVQALADQLRAAAAPLAAAVTQNTPAGGPQPQA